jgi:hypothetical protein
MKTKLFLLCSIIAAVAAAAGASAGVTAQLEPQKIAPDQTAQLTITSSGGGDDSVSPPTVPGLAFVSVGQSTQMQSVNGVTTTSTSDTYDVIPQHAGTFTIPALSAGMQPLVLYVQPGSAASGGNPPPPATTGSSTPPPSLTLNGAAFVRLVLPKTELYVGESVPVDIQVGYRPGMVASLDGLPSLNGDAFTLNKLSGQPEQTEGDVKGQPFTVLTWHSILAAVKPGDFSISVDTPLTVRIRTAPQRLPGGFFDDSMFDDSFFQNFFGGTTEKEVTLTSDPEALKIIPLPTQGRPTGFSGAIGQFEAGSELSAANSAAGDPLTLRLKVTGTGNFDRVSSPMLGELEGWKTYQATAKFAPADSAGYSGEKDFEQAVIPLNPGRQTVPALAFSFFNPDTRQYETKKTAPLTVEVSPAPPGSVTASVPPPAAGQPQNGLRPDHVETGETVATLRPLYFQTWFVGTQGALAVTFAAGLILMSPRKKAGNGASRPDVEKYLAEMDAASIAGDAPRFFHSARIALQQKLAARWHVAPASITIADIDGRLNGAGGEIRRVFALADQAAYSGQRLTIADFKQWREIVCNQIKQTEAL